MPKTSNGIHGKTGKTVNRSQKKKSVRGSKFTMLLSKEEQAALHDLANTEGVPASVYLRMLIRSESAKMNEKAARQITSKKMNGAA